MQKQTTPTHLPLDDANIYLLAGIVGLLLGINPNASEVNLGTSPDHGRAQADCIKEAKLLDDGSCMMTCSPVSTGPSTDELCRDFTPHAGALADEFGRMVGFADLFAAGYEAEAVSPAHEAAFRTWLIDVSPAVAKFTADLAQTNRRLALAL